MFGAVSYFGVWRMRILAVLILSLSLFLTASLDGLAANAPVKKEGNEKLGTLVKGAQAEGMLNLVWGENTFRGLQGVRELVSGMNKQFGTSVIANWTPGPSQPQMAAKIAQEFRTRTPKGLTGYFLTQASRLSARSMASSHWASH
jgi:hypothetical protein